MERNTMKIRTRMLALVLVLSFLLGLCGCLPADGPKGRDGAGGRASDERSRSSCTGRSN